VHRFFFLVTFTSSISQPGSIRLCSFDHSRKADRFVPQDPSGSYTRPIDRILAAE
jgi:hypothetical protein